MQRHADAVWRVCLLYFPQEADRQDAFQETFLRYALADDTAFEDEEHRKAWLIRVARTRCLDMLKSADRKRSVHDPDVLESAASATPAQDASVTPGSFLSEVIDAMQALDDPPRTPLYLAICEEYKPAEIARMLDAPLNTVYSWISRGKQRLREVLS